MILILSEERDHATNDVIDWLRQRRQPFLRINDSDEIQLHDIRITSSECNLYFSLHNDPKTYSLSDFQSYWYRRGDICLAPPQPGKVNALSERIGQYLQHENGKLREFFLRELDKIPNRIGSILDLKHNKLSNLVAAAECGLLIPDTHVITQRKTLRKLHAPLVSKAIYNNFDVFTPEYHVNSYTSRVQDTDMEADEALFPSLVQGFVRKQLDLRVFYLRKRMWAAAVFSQNDEQTKTDYRRYNDAKPNRMEALQLPAALQKNICRLMDKLEMACGSLDFALTARGEYYFLEVNPVGQFSAMSFACGFNIEKAIADELCKPYIS